MDHRDSMDEQSEDDGDGESSGAAATGPVSAAHGAGIQHVGHGRTSCSFCALGPEASEGGTREGTKITAEEAATIFCARCPYAKTAKHPTLSHDLSQTFGISQRAVRDIWNLRTWGEVTRPYWNAEDYQRFHEKYAATRMCASCREAVNQARLAIAWQGSQAGPSQSQTAAGGYPGGSHLHLQSTAGAGPFAARPLPDSATAQHVAFASMPSSFPPAWPSLQCAMPQASVNQSASWSGSGLPITQAMAYTAQESHSMASAAPAVNTSQDVATAELCYRLAPASWPGQANDDLALDYSRQGQTAAGGPHVPLHSTAEAETGPFAARPSQDYSSAVLSAQHDVFASMAYSVSFPTPDLPGYQDSMPQVSMNRGASWSGSGLPVTQPVEPAAVADLAGNNAGGTFINGWVMPEWLTPPDVELPDSFSDEEGATGSTNV